MPRRTYTWNSTVLTPEQTAQVLWQAGFRDMNVIATMVAIAKRESGYRAGVHGSDAAQNRVSGDRGLFQINYIHDAKLKAAGIIQRSEDLFDPVINARAALYLSGNGNQQAINQLWGAGPGGWTSGGNPMYGTNINAARQAVQNAQSSGLLTTPYNSQSTPGGPQGQQQALDPSVQQWLQQQSAQAAAYYDQLYKNAQTSIDTGNAYTSMQADYAKQQQSYENQMLQLQQQGLGFKQQEADVEKAYQDAVARLTQGMTDAQKVATEAQWQELQRNVKDLRSLADKGQQDSKAYYDKSVALEQKIYNATVSWLGKQKGFTQEGFNLALIDIGLVLTNESRKLTRDATARGARTSLGFGQDIGQVQKEAELGKQQADLELRSQLGQLTAQEQEALTSRDKSNASLLRAYQQDYEQFMRQHTELNNQINTGQISYQRALAEIEAQRQRTAAEQARQQALYGINKQALATVGAGYNTQASQNRSQLQNTLDQLWYQNSMNMNNSYAQMAAAQAGGMQNMSPYGVPTMGGSGSKKAATRTSPTYTSSVPRGGYVPVAPSNTGSFATNALRTIARQQTGLSQPTRQTSQKTTKRTRSGNVYSAG